MTLSKSEYIMFLKQPAWLWLKKHDKSKLPEIDPNTQAMFDTGHLFEKYAEQLFPNAMRIGYSFENNNYVTMPRRTTEALENGTKTIFQGRFETENITCIVDVLDRVEGNTFDIYEIKSSTSVKIDHEYDLAFQIVVLEKAGLHIRHAGVILVNNQYIRNGKIDTKAITKITDVTEAVRELLDETKINIQKALKTIESTTPPSMSPRFVRFGPIDEWLAIYKSLYNVDPHSIYNLTSLKAPLVGELEDLGITLIKDIPDTIKLTEKQRLQVHTTKHNKRVIEKTKISNFLKDLKYPLYFLDYETLSSVIPPFDGTKPYQQVPFQYSLHILETPDAELKHKEFLHKENSNPGLPLLQKLKEDIGDEGTILVWFEKFEKSRNKELGEMFPEYADFMQKVNNRVVDLIIPFSQGWFVDKDFFGSASIKKVLPVLVSELSYKELNIQEGASAQRLWMQTILEGKNSDSKDKIMADLIEYCKLDTLAMVQLYKVLQAETFA